MRRGHRQGHLLIWVVLAVLLPVGLILGLITRQEMPVETTVVEPAPPSPADEG